MDLTDLTKQIGTTIAKIKNYNTLVDEVNKRFNPTFVEIMQDLEDTDPTLAAMLMLWYNKKYNINESEIQIMINEMENSESFFQKLQMKGKKSNIKKYTSSCDYSCGSTTKRYNDRC